MYRILLITLTAGLMIVIAGACGDDQPDDSENLGDPTASATAVTEETSSADPSPTLDPTPTRPPESADNEEASNPIGELWGTEHDGNDEPFVPEPDDWFDDFQDDELAAMLLDINEIPTDWYIIYEGSLPDDGELAPGMEAMGAPCNKAPWDFDALGNPVHVSRGFANSDFGPFLTQDLFSYDTSEQAAEVLGFVHSEFDCGEWIEEEPDTGMELLYHVEEFDFPALGDETAALSISVSAVFDEEASLQRPTDAQSRDPFDVLTAQTIMIRHGNRFAYINAVEYFGAGDVDVEALATRAAEKLESGE